jgi:hypothetical protein
MNDYKKRLEYMEAYIPVPQKRVAPNYDHITKYDYWTMREAVSYLCEASPGTVEDYHGNYDYYSQLCELAERAIDSESIEFMSDTENEKSLNKVKVKPVDFLEWARAKGFDIPEPLQKLLWNRDGESELSSAQNETSKIKERIEIIDKLAVILFPEESMNIPDGGKAQIKKILIAIHSKLFKPATFKKAWQAGLDRKPEEQIYKMANSKNFSSTK